MTNEEKIIKISEILIKLINENLGNKLSISLGNGILNIFQSELDKLLKELDNQKNIDKENYNK